MPKIDNDIEPPRINPESGPAWMQHMHKAGNVADGMAVVISDKYEGLADYVDSYDPGSASGAGLAVAWAMVQANVKPPKDFLRAAAWEKFGFDVKTPEYGCVVCLEGHVALFHHQVGTTIYLLGGNEIGTVSLRPYEADDIIACRWPEGDDYDTGYTSKPPEAPP